MDKIKFLEYYHIKMLIIIPPKKKNVDYIVKKKKKSVIAGRTSGPVHSRLDEIWVYNPVYL